MANIIKTKNITVINIQIKYFCFYLSNIIIHEILEINVNFIKKIQLYKLNKILFIINIIRLPMSLYFLINTYLQNNLKKDFFKILFGYFCLFSTIINFLSFAFFNSHKMIKTIPKNQFWFFCWSTEIRTNFKFMNI